ncbi:MAG: aspartate-semialdehyde dehydrogenase [Capsulimonadaceae bacterium]|nr:aspartate-semialdehyde dehydrogenase [Capsulimonadaceae bacterium]
MSKYEVAVVGVGAVGEEMLRVLSEHNFPASNIRVLARSERTISVDGRTYQVQATTPEAFDGVDVALFAGTEGEKGAAVTFGEEAVRRGAVVIDNGADFRMRADVPLVVPEVNGEALRNHKGIIANPNCSTAQLVMALKPLHDFGKLTRVLVSTYQAVSGAGSGGVAELKAQTKALAAGEPIAPPSTFSTQIAANVIPQIGGFDDLGYTSEEMKLVHETHKILGDSTIQITPMITARVPVVLGHSEAVYVETERPISTYEARRLWGDFPGVVVLDEIHGKNVAQAYPTPLQAAGSDMTFIGRIRQDVSRPNGLVFWVVSDNLRKGAASNAVQIAEKLVELDLLRR